MASPDDQTWIRHAIRRFERPLLHYAAGITRDGELARDVVQDTFLKLCRAERTAVEGRLAAWLYTVTRHRAIDVCRKEARMTTTEHTTLAGEQPEAAALAERQEAISRALAQVERLPEKQREVIQLKFQAGLSYAQIAEVTGLTVSYVGVLIHNGMKTLRGRLGATTRPAGGNAR